VEQIGKRNFKSINLKKMFLGKQCRIKGQATKHCTTSLQCWTPWPAASVTGVTACAWNLWRRRCWTKDRGSVGQYYEAATSGDLEGFRACDLSSFRARLGGPIPSGFPAFSRGQWPTGLSSSGWCLGPFGCPFPWKSAPPPRRAVFAGNIRRPRRPRPTPARRRPPPACVPGPCALSVRRPRPSVSGSPAPYPSPSLAPLLQGPSPSPTR
jgi:hypothetical protein